jgi:alpha-galactosidase
MEVCAVPNAVNIAVVGAGSSQFSLALIRDLVLTSSLEGSRLTLMDIDPDRMEPVANLSRRYADDVGRELSVRTTASLGEALEGADFVINTALAGGHKVYEAERQLAERHGYYRGISVLHMQRNLILMLEVARAMGERCPDAWLIQAGNPVFEGCTLMTRETRQKVVGLCHGYRGYLKVARILGLDPDRITWQAPGFNHCVYLTEFTYDGESIYPLLDEWIATKAAEYWARTDLRYNETDLSRAAIDHYRRVGVLPLGDTARAFDNGPGPSTWWYHQDMAAKQRWFGELGGFDSGPGWAQYLEHLEEGLRDIRKAVADTATPVSELLPLVPSGEHHIELIESLVTGRERVLQVNLPNNGAIDGIADDIVVEGKGVVTRGKIQLLQVGSLPEQLYWRIFAPRQVLLQQTLLAFREHDLSLLREIMLNDHRTTSTGQVDSLLDEALRSPDNASVASWYSDK